MKNHLGKLRAGNWRAILQTPGGELPFQMEVYQEGEKCMIDFINGEEQLSTEEITWQNNEVRITPAVFNSQIQATIADDGRTMSGKWCDFSRGADYFLPFSAQWDTNYRFSEYPREPMMQIDGQWKTTFLTEQGESSIALGILNQDGNHLTGTFLTATGDYRFLEGEVDGSRFALSAFDGSHAFLFTGEMVGETLHGTFYSGNHWKETFTASRDATFMLPDPTETTFLTAGQAFHFRFPDDNGQITDLSDARFQNKPVIVQIMATWCPNCMDETALLAEFYRKYHREGLEIVAIAFERETSTDAVIRNVHRLRRRFGIEYPILLGGNSSKKTASAAFPMLNSVIAFPTTIILDHHGHNHLLYTGFNGPATGELYVRLKKELTGIIESLL